MENETAFFWTTRWPRSYVTFVGHRIVRFLGALHALGVCAISFGVLISKFGVARAVIYPVALAQIARSGLRCCR